jgi:S1-C subfamily serine protease
MFEDKGRNSFLRFLITAVIASLGTGVLLFMFISGYTTRNTPVPQSQQRTNVPGPQQIVAETPGGPAPAATGTPTASVARSATPGVVGISVLKVESGALFDGKATEKWGVGSGVIASSDGYILTNDHVAGGKNKRIIVSLLDGRNVDGVTLWTDPVLDLAVVKINASGLTTIPFGDADALQVGEPAIAIGNPLGLQFQRTVTSGIISALNRTIQIDTDQGSNYMEDLIQTDASINPGNSGGPLLNSKGQVVGINTIKVTSAEAIGFAIPINVAVPIIKKFVQSGTFVEPYMGVFAYDKEVIPYLDKTISIDNGIYVANVDNNGPAYKSGIRVGCIIKQVDGININTMIQLRTYIYSKNPGDTINLTHILKADGKVVTVPMKLAAKEKDGLVTR